MWTHTKTNARDLCELLALGLMLAVGSGAVGCGEESPSGPAFVPATVTSDAGAPEPCPAGTQRGSLVSGPDAVKHLSCVPTKR
jgi:hypothetical protein